MAPKEIVIFGAGGMGREVRQIIERINLQQRVWRCLGFLVDERFRVPEPVHDLPVLTGLDALGGLPGAAVAVAVGDPAARREIVERIRLRFENPFATLVDPRATCGDYVRLGPGTVVAPGAVITTDVVIGDHVIINVGASVSHDARLASYVTLAPGERAELLRTRWDEGEAGRWSLRSLDLGAAYAGAVALEAHDWSLSCWEFAA